MADGFAILIFIIVALPLTMFNILTIAIIVFDRNLRRLPTNYPIASFLCASALQGMTAAPVYVYKKLLNREKVNYWICDTSRLTYFICGHTMKMSLLIISFDRMLSIRYPYIYEKHVTKQNMSILLTILWIITIGIDIIPFTGEKASFEDCHHVPTRVWGLFVIVTYNIIPFCLMTVNYTLIWMVAAKFAVTDQKRINSLSVGKISNLLRTSTGFFLPKAKPLNFNNTGSKLKFALDMKATKTSLTLIAVYLICWGPIGVFYMIDHFYSHCYSKQGSLSKTRMSIKLLCFTSSLIAPIVYCWINDRYKKASKRVFKKFGFIIMTKKEKKQSRRDFFRLTLNTSVTSHHHGLLA